MLYNQTIFNFSTQNISNSSSLLQQAFVNAISLIYPNASVSNISVFLNTSIYVTSTKASTVATVQNTANNSLSLAYLNASVTNFSVWFYSSNVVSSTKDSTVTNSSMILNFTGLFNSTQSLSSPTGSFSSSTNVFRNSSNLGSSKSRTTRLVTLAANQACQLQIGKKVLSAVEKILLSFFNVRNVKACCALCNGMSGCDYFEFTLISNVMSNCSLFSFSDQSTTLKFGILMGRLYENQFFSTSIIGFNDLYLFSGF
jgi:hypothetical protein